MPELSGPDVLACTIVARNYLPAARVLADSYLEHHPDHRFVIAVTDAPPGADSPRPRCRVTGPQSFGIPDDDYLRMATAYSVTELATAVKPYLLRELRRDADVVIYLDPDIQVFAPMPELAGLATANGVVLTPHFLTPLPRDGKEPDEAVIMGTGVFNLGFLAVGPGSEPFLDFWAARLRHDAIVAPDRQLFTDQRWVDLVPALFPHHVLRDPGFNVAYWNLHEREVRRAAGDALTAAGRPLRFFHFSGYRPEKSWLLTYHCARKPRVLLSEHPYVRELCDGYGAALQAAGYGETLESVPYGFAMMSDGTELTPFVRRLVRDAWVAADRAGTAPPPHAFGPPGDSGLRDWLTSPEDAGQAAAGLHRLAMTVWGSRIDLQVAFPKPCGADAEAFRGWCRRHGSADHALPDWALPADPAAPSRPVADFGVNLLGYLTAALGLGEMGRIVHDAMTAAGIEVVSVVEDKALSNRTDVAHRGATGSPRFPVSMLALNADQTAQALTSRPEVAHERYVIGLWAWELEDFPDWQHHAFELVDEVWTVSDFCRGSFGRHATVPVRTIPVPVPDPGEPPARDREPGTPVRFLFAFDYNSVAERKNPWGLVTAFRQAFPGRDDVRLTIKAINSGLHPHSAERLRLLVAGDERIELVERYMSVAELDELYRRSDCYVSLHRSEGFGLTVAEAMARALPVIATDYSGTAEFLDESTGWPVPHGMTAVGEGCYPYQADARWAEPDLAAAAEAMRAVAGDPAEARRRGAAARAHVLRTRSMARAADWLRTELTRAHQAWLARTPERARPDEPPGEDVAEGPLRALREAREALLWRPEVAAASRTPFAPAMRRAVLRAIDHYDVHQRAVMGTLMDGVERSMAQLVSRLESVESALARADRQSYDQLRARDRRADRIETELAQANRELRALHDAARLRHSPVPSWADVVLCDAGALLVPVDKVFLPWLVHHRSWERGEADLMATLVTERPGVFLDIGAHVGYHTLRLFGAAPDLPGAVAVEIDPNNLECLRRNLTVNLPAEPAERVTVLELAAWDAGGQVELVHADPANSGDHRVRALTGVAPAGGTAVAAGRLDDRPEVRGATISLVKVDLQGRDHRALTGLTEVLQRDQPDVICEFCPEAIEELGDDPFEVLAAYRKLGYRMALVDEGGPVPGDHDDETLVRRARAADSGFLTLWLRRSTAG